MDFSGIASFGGDQYNPVGTTHTEDSGGGGIFQYVQRFYFIGIYAGKVFCLAFDAVDDIGR